MLLSKLLMKLNLKKNNNIMSRTQVIVGLGSCGIAAGASKVYNKLSALKEAENLDFILKKTSCVGMCYKEPLVEVIDENGSFLYGEINEDKAVEIIQEHIINQNPIKDYVVKSEMFGTGEEDFFDSQVKIALRNCGVIEPEDINDYLQKDGYAALKKRNNFV